MRSTTLSSIVLAIFVLLTASEAMAVGEATAQSLIIAPSARANGMGQSFVALADDATAAWWNPAGLAFLKKNNIALMHSNLLSDLFTDIYYEYLGYAREISGLGSLGISFVYLSYGEMIHKSGPQSPEIPFKSWEGYLMGSYGMRLAENLGFGLSMKFIYVDLAPAWATPTGRKGAGSSIALDVGGLWKLPELNTQFGMTVTNIGPDVNYEDKEQPNPLPTTLRAGAAFQAVSDDISNLILTLEIEQSLVWLVQQHVKVRSSEVWHVGVEYRYLNLLAGRAGYIYDRDGDIRSATYGLGFLYKSVMFDYASVPQSTELDRVHRWSIALVF